MIRPYFRSILSAACAVVLSAVAPCHAHFLWLKTISHDNNSQAFLFFGENAADEAYHLPERLAGTQVWRRTADGTRAKLTTKPLDTDERIGLVAPLDADPPCALEATQQYGIYGNSLLVYYAKHVHADSGKQLNAAGPSKDLNLDIVPQAQRGELHLTVLWKGKPLEGAKVTVAAGDREPIEKTTDSKGLVVIEPENRQLVSALANYIEKNSKGEVDGKPYAGVMHYSSLTIVWSKPIAAGEPATSNAPPQAALPPLPEPLSSFGAAVTGGWLYVYGGHTGDEHEHSAANLSKHFHRIKLADGAMWEKLPMELPLQGLALVSHGGMVYRVGGLHARNATTKEKEDLHSTADFAQFDPATGRWQPLAPLPAPRSSHNAVVIGERLYIVGGWQLKGKSPGQWQPDALAYDFADPAVGWQKLPQPPFKRRALAVGNWQGKLVAIGGMDEKEKVSRRVDLFDPRAGEWSLGPKLPGAGLAGFGGAACDLEGQIYVSGLRGVVYRLNETGSAWVEAGRMSKGRFFHQFLPAGVDRLLAIGGASRRGHLADVEWIAVTSVGDSTVQ